MMTTFALYLGLFLIFWSLGRAVRQTRERKEQAKKKLYEIVLAEIDGVDLDLIDCYCDLLKLHGVDSPQTKFMRRTHCDNKRFLQFCDSVDSIESMLQ